MTTTTAPPAGAQTGTPQPASPRKRGHRGNRTPGEGRMAALLLSPTILVLALVIVYPARVDPMWARGGVCRDGARVPLPWTEAPVLNHGFSLASTAASSSPEP